MTPIKKYDMFVIDILSNNEFIDVGHLDSGSFRYLAVSNSEQMLKYSIFSLLEIRFYCWLLKARRKYGRYSETELNKFLALKCWVL